MKPFGDMERVFDQYQALNPFDNSDWTPASDIEETDSEYLVITELPGVEKADVEIKIEENVLIITGEKKSISKDTKKHRIERSYGSFSRRFSLPEKIDSNGVKATFEQGILSLKIPKIDEPKAKEIEISID
jgi:HSP20 family protein